MKKVILSGLMVVLGASAAFAGPLQLECERAMKVYADMAGTVVASRCMKKDEAAAWEKARSIYQAAGTRVGRMQLNGALENIKETINSAAGMQSLCSSVQGFHVNIHDVSQSKQDAFYEQELSDAIFDSVKEGCKGK